MLNLFIHKLRISFIVFLFCLSGWATIPVLAQHPTYLEYGVRDGLPTEEIFNLYFSKSGYLWLGTEEGLVRFDGRNFKNYRTPKEFSLPVSNIVEDKNGRIWCHNFSGQIFVVAGDSLALFTPTGSQIGFNFRSFVIDKHDQLWMTLPRGIQRYAISDWVPGSTPQPNFEWQEDIFSPSIPFVVRDIVLLEDSLSIAFISSDQVIRLKEGEISRLPNIIDHILKNQDKPFRLFGVQHRPMVVSMTDAEAAYASETDYIPYKGLQSSIQRKESVITNIRRDAQGNLWMANYNGLKLIENKTTPFKEGTVFLENYAVSDILIDSEGNYWVSTLRNGLLRIPSLWVSSYTKENSFLQSNHVTKLSSNGIGEMYLGMGDGSVMQYSYVSGKAVELAPKGRRSPTALYFDPLNDVLYHARDGIRVYDTNQKTWRDIDVNFAVKDMLNDGDNNLLIGANNHLVIGNAKGYLGKYAATSLPWWRVSYIRLSEQTKNNLLLIGVTTVNGVAFQPLYQRIWAAHVDGLRYYDAQREHLLLDPLNNKPIIAKSVVAVNGDEVWVAHADGGILCFRNATLIRRIDVSETSRQSPYKRIQEIDWGVMAFSRNAIDFYRFDGTKQRSITASDGLVDAEILDVLFEEDIVWVATNQGLQRFDLNGQFSPKQPPKVIFNTILVGSDEQNWQDKPLQFEYYQNRFSLGFQALAFRTVNELHYYYRLLPLDQDWQRTSDSNPVIRYANLSHGIYRFEVKAVLDNQTLDAPVSTLEWQIERPYWLRAWFLFSMMLIVAGFVYATYFWRVQSITEQKMKDQEKEHLMDQLRLSQMTAIKAQMNPHFVFNALNSIQSFIFKNDKLSANKYLGTFSELIRTILEMSNHEEVTIHDEVKALDLYLKLEAIRFGDNLSFTITVAPEIDPDEQHIPSMMIQPYVENAIKHGLQDVEHPRVDVRFLLDDDQTMHIEIEDNGIGRQKSQERNATKMKTHKSFATKGMDQRVDLLNQGRNNPIQIEFIDKLSTFGEPQGLLVRITIPHHEHRT